MEINLLAVTVTHKNGEPINPERIVFELKKIVYQQSNMTGLPMALISSFNRVCVAGMTIWQRSHHALAKGSARLLSTAFISIRAVTLLKRYSVSIIHIPRAIHVFLI